MKLQKGKNDAASNDVVKFAFAGPAVAKYVKPDSSHTTL
jgi:hypothetical protein